MSSPPVIPLEAIVESFRALDTSPRTAVPAGPGIPSRFLVPPQDELGPPMDEVTNLIEPRDSRGASKGEPRHIQQFRSASPPEQRGVKAPREEQLDGNEHLQKLDPQTVSEMNVGASVMEWMMLISEFKKAEVEGKADEPASLTVLNTLKRFTNLPVDTIMETLTAQYPSAFPSADSGASDFKYVETIFNKQHRVYVQVYTGRQGGKYIKNIDGTVKYLTPDQKKLTVMKDTAKTSVKNVKPAFV